MQPIGPKHWIVHSSHPFYQLLNTNQNHSVSLSLALSIRRKLRQSGPGKPFETYSVPPASRRTAGAGPRRTGSGGRRAAAAGRPAVRCIISLIPGKPR